MLPEQPDQNPSAENARQRERCQQQRQHARPVICQNSALPKDECPYGQANNRGGGRAANRRDAIFLNPRPASGQSVDCGRTAKPSPMEILQHGPTNPRTLENADHQNIVIALLSPKSHSQLYRIYWLGNIDAIVQLRLQQTASQIHATRISARANLVGVDFLRGNRGFPD
jgi:hypothetical protein